MRENVLSQANECQFITFRLLHSIKIIQNYNHSALKCEKWYIKSRTPTQYIHLQSALPSKPYVHIHIHAWNLDATSAYQSWAVEEPSSGMYQDTIMESISVKGVMQGMRGCRIWNYMIVLASFILSVKHLRRTMIEQRNE